MRRVKLLLTLAIFLLLPALGLGAVYDPAGNWKTLATPHFNFHYPEKLSVEAANLAVKAESLEPEMTKLAGWEPDSPVEIVLSDNIDLANGSATVLGPNTIVLYAVQPEYASGLADYSDWLTLVFIHEYAHILSLDYRRGYADITRIIFGKVDVPLTSVSAIFWLLALPPNALLPPWAVEGIGVNFESDLTGRGRKDSTWYDTVYRADVAENRIPPMDRLGGDYPRWPSYDTRYIYGTRLMGMIADKKGLAGLGDVFRLHGGRVPFFIENPPKTLMGKDYRGLYKEMVKELNKEFLPAIEKIKAKGVTPFTLLTGDGTGLGAPRWISPTKIAFTRDTPHRTPTLVVADTETGKTRTLTDRPGNLTRPAIDQEGALIFPMLSSERPWAGSEFHNSVYRMLPDGWCPKKLTSGLRVRYLDRVSADSSYAAVILEGTNQRLSLLTFTPDGIKEKVLLREENVRYDSVAVSPDSTRIAFSRKTPESSDQLALIDIDGSNLRLLTPDNTRAGSPSWSPDGETIVFSSDANKVFNLYVLDVAKGIMDRITNLIGGGFSPDFSPDGKKIAFLSYSAEGFDLAVMDFKLGRARPVGISQADYPTVTPNVGKTSAPDPDLPAVKDYNGLKYLLPGYWLPDITVDNAGGVYGVMTTANDPLLNHAYTAAAYWSAGNSRPYGIFSYSNNSWYPTFTFTAWKVPVFHSKLLGSYDYWEESRMLSLEARQNFNGVLAGSYLALGYRAEEVKRLSRIDEDLDGNVHLANLAFEGRKDALYLEAGVDTTYGRLSSFNVAPEGGRRITASFTLRDDSLGSDYDSKEVRGFWAEFIPLPLLDRWVLSLVARGAYGKGDSIVQSLFQGGGETSEFPLRGYPDRSMRGEKILTGTGELAFPLFKPYRGISDMPFFFSRLDGAVFGEMGRTWDSPDGDETRRSVGVETRLNTLIGYYLPLTVTLGYAKGFDEDGEDRVYLLLSLGGSGPVGALPGKTANLR